MTSLVGAGGERTLGQWAGKPLVVNLWATWCAPCRREMPAFQAVHEKLGGRVSIVGVTDDLNQSEARKMARSLGVTYPLLVDDKSDVQVGAGVSGLPTTLFFDTRGRIVARHSGELSQSALLKQIGVSYGIT